MWMDNRYVDTLSLAEQLGIEERTVSNMDFNVKREVSTNEVGTIRGGRGEGRLVGRGLGRSKKQWKA